MADLNNLNNTPDITDQMDPADIEKNKVMGVLAYLSWLVIIPILAAKDSPFARFHSNQGLILAIAAAIIWVVGMIPVIGWIVSLVGNIAIFIFSILGLVNVFNGKAKELPLIGKFKILK